MPRVSIVLPTYNGSRYLATALDSILAQTYADWELVIVDDCSKDSTPEIIEQYKAKDARIRSVRNEPNKKLPASLNEGFSHAQGELLTWTSDDNIVRPQALERLVAYFDEHPELDLVYSDMSLIDDDGKVTGFTPAGEVEDLTLFNGIRACFMYRRKVHEELGGYATEKFLVEDWDFWLRAAKKFKLAPLHEDLYLYREHAESLSSTRTREIITAVQQMIARHMDELPWMNRRNRARTYLHMASNWKRLGNRPLFLWNLMKAGWNSPAVLFQKLRGRYPALGESLPSTSS